MEWVEEYQIVEANGLSDLTLKVNELLAKDWQPQGGPFSTESGFGQAMVLGE